MLTCSYRFGVPPLHLPEYAIPRQFCLARGYIGIMEKQMETTMVWGGWASRSWCGSLKSLDRKSRLRYFVAQQLATSITCGWHPAHRGHPPVYAIHTHTGTGRSSKISLVSMQLSIYFSSGFHFPFYYP